MVQEYQNAAEIIVQIVYAVVLISVIVGAVYALRLMFGKTNDQFENTINNTNSNTNTNSDEA